MRKKAIITGAIFGLLMATMLGIYLYGNTYAKYIPMDWQGGSEFVKVPELNTELHKENLQLVLAWEGYDWKVKDGEIYIQRRLTWNADIIQNLTLSANETDFIVYLKKMKKESPEFFKGRQKN